MVSFQNQFSDPIDILPSEFAQAYLEIKRRQFSFDGYEFFRRIYDTSARGMVLKTARQVAKCLDASQYVRMSDGSIKNIMELAAGDQLVSFDGMRRSSGRFMDREFAGCREVFEVKTRNGHSVRATGNHPLRTPDGWTNIDDLCAGSVVAADSGIQRTGAYWDEIVSTASLGERDTYHIQVDPYKNFVTADGLVSHNSTTLAAKFIMWCCTIPSFNCLYVAPTENHISMFSKQKLTPLLASPFIKRRFFTKDKTDQVFYKQLADLSDITLRSCFLDPESVRGIACDAIGIDELQNINVDSIPVIEECYTKSDYQYAIYSGTPKTNQHATEYYWDLSTQNEWLIKCTSCNYWNFLDESCVLPQGLSCAKCAKLLPRQDPDAGEWVSFDTSGKNRMDGYRVSQLMVPWIPWDLEESIKLRGENADERATIMYKFKKYGRSKFYNEVMGLSYDDATCPITLSDLIDACDPKLKMRENRRGSTVVSRMTLYAGIDWSTSQDSASYTVLTIGGYVPGGQFVVIYAKRYEGAQADLKPMLAHIVKKIRDFGIKVVGVDWGSGADKNTIIRDMLRLDNVSVVEFNHSGTQKADVSWNAKAKLFIVNRTRVMTEVFNRVKNKDIVFPCWNDMQDFLADMLNVYTDFNEVLKVTFFNHPPNKPDDYVHALCFCHLAATIGQQGIN